MQALEILHETRGRLRVRLAGSGFNGAWLESWMESLPGVREVRVNPRLRSAVVAFEPSRVSRESVLARLRGYRATEAPRGRVEPARTGELTPVVRTAATLLVLRFLSPARARLLTFANALPIVADGAGTLLAKGITVEVLDALAVGLAALKGENHTANLTAFLLALGEYLERQTEHRSDKLLRRLLQPEPAPAWVERGGELVRVAGDAVRVGEVVAVGPGETVAVDGRVMDGVALVNQAAVTGEELPVRREAGARVVAGSVVEEGRLRVEARRAGAETTTAHIASFIRASLEQRSDTQRMAEKLADQRVWITLGAGALVYGLTRDPARLEAVFLVDYACALRLGTAVAFKAALQRAATRGVLVRGGAAIERLAEVDTVVFDKTGTLTRSELDVTDVVAFGPEPMSEDVLLALVASVEEHSSHPLAQAVVEAARGRDLKHISHGEVDYLVAHGLSAEVEGHHVIIGSRHFLEEHHGISFAEHAAVIDRLQAEGKTLLYVGCEGTGTGQPVGVVALRDTLRADAAAAIQRLRALGITRLVMMTGDKRAKGEALAVELGIDEVHAEMAPEEKAGVIRRLQEGGARVAFVGDGINDGPALSVAHVGIAMPRGADIARATAHVVLLDDHVTAVADAREVATGTMALIRSNFKVATGVNTAVLAGALLGRLSPVMSAFLHNGTTIGVLLRSLAGAGETPVREEAA